MNIEQLKKAKKAYQKAWDAYGAALWRKPNDATDMRPAVERAQKEAKALDLARREP